MSGGRGLAALAATSVFALSACSGREGAATYSAGEVVAPRIELPTVAPPDVRPVSTTPPELQRVRLLAPVLRGAKQLDSFTQDDALVDVLWIVDNSASVSNERDRLVAQLDRFLQVLLAADVDFHVGVTSTDLASPVADGGRLRGTPAWIDRSTPDPEAVFARAVRFPLDLDVRLEEGLTAMERALSPPLSTGANRGFLRPEAGLAVIVVSDEDDASIGETAHYVRFLRSLVGAGQQRAASFSAVVGPQPDGCASPGEERIFGARAKPGDRYIEVALATSGQVESICSPDFGPFVESLAIALSGLRRFFPLSAPADPASIVVRVDGRIIPESAATGWVYDPATRGVSFPGRFVPPPGADVRIDYDVAI